MKSLIRKIEASVQAPEKGLPDDIFYLVGRLTPFINVDLLLRDQDGNVLFTWRDDVHSGTGWHLPGGIIRFRESWLERVKAVALNEIGVKLEWISNPISINELIVPDKRERSHFISLLFECSVNEKNNLTLKRKAKENPENFFLCKGAPEKLLGWHRIYLPYLES